MKRARLNTMFPMLPTQKIQSAVTLLAVLTLSVGCVSRAPSVEVAPGTQQPPQAPQTNDWNNINTGDQSLGYQDTGSLTAVLDERVLKDNFNVNTANLSYKFSFLGKSDTGAIRFSQGKSRISLNKLKPNQAGTVSLEIFEGATLRLKGERQNVTLRPGQNEMELTLRLMTPPPGNNSAPGPNNNPGNNVLPPNTQPQDTSLSINVTIEGNASPAPNSNVQPPVTPPQAQPPQTQPQPPQAQPQPGTPSQPWNGIGDRGNESWSIESLD